MVGTYTLTYTATDASGNAGTATRTVTVSDTIVPILTVIGSAEVTTEKGFTYTDPGATAIDQNDRNDLTGATGKITVVTSGTVDTNVVGTYTLTFTATDTGGNAATGTRTVNVSDTLAPTFTSSSTFTADENQTAIGTVKAYDINTRNDLTGNLGAVTFSMTDSEMVITSAGVLSFRNAPDFEDNKSNTFIGVVTATDDESNSSSQTITVTINDVGGFDDNPDTGTETSTVTDVVVEVETEVAVGTGTGTATVTTTATGTTNGT